MLKGMIYELEEI